MEPRSLTAAIHAEGDQYIARCLEIDVASQGETIEDALANLRDAVELYLDEALEPEVEPTPFVVSFQVPDMKARARLYP